MAALLFLGAVVAIGAWYFVSGTSNRGGGRGN
jgi:hypothetical protein